MMCRLEAHQNKKRLTSEFPDRGGHRSHGRDRAALADVLPQGIGALRGGTLDILLELGLEIFGRHGGRWSWRC